MREDWGGEVKCKINFHEKGWAKKRIKKSAERGVWKIIQNILFAHEWAKNPTRNNITKKYQKVKSKERKNGQSAPVEKGGFHYYYFCKNRQKRRFSKVFFFAAVRGE